MQQTEIVEEYGDPDNTGGAIKTPSELSSVAGPLAQPGLYFEPAVHLFACLGPGHLLFVQFAQTNCRVPQAKESQEGKKEGEKEG